MSTNPITCTLTPIELQKRRKEVLKKIRDQVDEVISLSNGFKLKFPANDDCLNEVMQMI